MSRQPREPDAVTSVITMELSWRYASGAAMERFCAALGQRRIEALQCDECGRRYLPPRPLCGDCCVPMSRWVPVQDRGVLEAWTVVHVPMLGGRTGRPRPTPYGMGLIRLEGADTTLNHFLDLHDPAALRIGQRVRAVWRPQLRGAMDDILHFEVSP